MLTLSQVKGHVVRGFTVSPVASGGEGGCCGLTASLQPFLGQSGDNLPFRWFGGRGGGRPSGGVSRQLKVRSAKPELLLEAFYLPPGGS